VYGQNTLQHSILTNATEKKPLLIGNVTELTVGRNWQFSNTIYENSATNFGTPHTNTFGLSHYFIINNFLVQSGGEYGITSTDLSLDYQWDSVYTSQVLVDDTIGTHYYILNGDSVAEYIIDQYYISQTNTEEKRIVYEAVTKTHQITIPLYFGYRWRYEKFAFYAKLGTKFNFITQTTGKIYLADNQEWIQLSEKVENKFYYSAAASIAFEYPFSRLCSFIFETDYHYNWHSHVNPNLTRSHHQL
jgi:hypothetical protein